MAIWSRKSLAALHSEANSGQLRRDLGAVNLTLIGIGSTVGAGIFAITGQAAATYAGPAVTLSFLLAALACLATALCYAELGSMIPVAGSAYTYAYATMGHLVAWIIGWNMVLEYLVASSTVAVSWSSYFSELLNSMGIHLPASLSHAPFGVVDHLPVLTGAIVDLPAVILVLALTALLLFGIRESARTNNLMVIVKLAVIVLVIGFGAAYVQPDNWTPFIPENTGESGHFGVSGVMRAAGVVFFAFIGFEVVSTSAQEAKNPKRDVPVALLAVLAVTTLLYVLMCLVMTGMAHYTTLNSDHPVITAMQQAGPGLAWLIPYVNVGALVGMASTIYATLYGQTRIFYVMGRDRMIPDSFARVDPQRQTPTTGTMVTGIACAAIAGLFPLDVLADLTSIGTLLAFAIVCAGVLVLRRTHPEAPRSFRTPGGNFTAIAGIAACGALMLSLSNETWIRLVVWLAIGAGIYLFYSLPRARRDVAAP